MPERDSSSEPVSPGSSLFVRTSTVTVASLLLIAVVTTLGLNVIAEMKLAPILAEHGLSKADARDAAWAVVSGYFPLALAEAVALGAFFVFVLHRWLSPLGTLASDIDAISRSRDLTRPLPTSASGEVGAIARAVQSLKRELAETVATLQESAAFLDDAGQNLSQTAQEQTDMLSRTATSLQQTQRTAQDIKETSVTASQKAQAVLAAADRATAAGEKGEGALEATLAGLQAIKGEVQEILDNMGRLGDRTRQIGGITASVKDLADQSNMLALNAAIEAVRSGEHGKGFSVVAREIRSLADQSIQATARVREILDDIAVAISDALSRAEKGGKRMEGGLEQVFAAGENLRALSSIVRENSDAVRQIATAVNQQNQGITELFSAVTDQMKSMDATRTRLEQRGHAAALFRDLAKRVNETVGRYKV